MILLVSIIASFFAGLRAETLEVGEGKTFTRIEDALAKAEPGDEIIVHPYSDGSAYMKPALLVRVPKLLIRATDPEKPVVLDGSGFVYSGVGTVPRAIIQFEPGADDCTIEGLSFTNARNESFNGAGIRINEANGITIRNCIFKNNDMGIMSNGVVSKRTGADQLIENCTISENGTEKDPGYNHNLYLGGTSVTVRNCTIERSLTGHNVKSRAHSNLFVDNIVRYSANREFDLVDAKGNTDVPGSDAYLIGNVITKAPDCKGNRTVIHFGKDGNSAHDGTIWLMFNTISTPFGSSVLDLGDGEGAVITENRFEDGGKGHSINLVNAHDSKMDLYCKNNDIPGKKSVVSTQKTLSKKTELPPIPEEIRAIIEKKREKTRNSSKPRT